MVADSNTCRLAFHGRIAAVIDPRDSEALQVILQLLALSPRGVCGVDKGWVNFCVGSDSQGV